MNNRKFSETNDNFLMACKIVNDSLAIKIPPSKRQASKWRIGKGIYFNTWRKRKRV